MDSHFAFDIENMMIYLHNQGFDLGYVQVFLNEFDTYCSIYYPERMELTKELAESWIAHSKTKSKQQKDKRIRTMKHLGKYLFSTGKESYIPNYRIAAPKTKEPSLFSNEQLSQFFMQMDYLPPDSRSPNREVIVPVLFRLIYCCGLRSSEVCKLKIADINFEKQLLTIHHSKGHKDRIVYMNDDIALLCFKFHNYYQTILPNRTYFFQPAHKVCYVNNDVNAFFDRCLNLTTLNHSFSKKPTPHGLRHLFAVNSMKKCLNEGENFNNWIKYLSQYMGHRNPQETMYYLHMVIQLLPEYAKKTGTLLEGLGVIYEED